MPAPMTPAFSAATIIALGKFDPDLFRVETLAASRAISEAEASRTKVQAIMPSQVAHFTLPWGELLVLADRLHATVTEAPFIRVADLVAQAMSMAGTRCSIRAFGINYEAHFDIGSVDARDEFAMKFAPPSAWGEWGGTVRAGMQSGNVETHSGLAVITMRERFRSGDIRGWYDVTLTGSEKVPNFTGVKFLTNHHHEYAPEAVSTAELSPAEIIDRQNAQMLGALESSFDASISKAERIFAEVLA
jgi:hypothetical protein